MDVYFGSLVRHMDSEYFSALNMIGLAHFQMFFAPVVFFFLLGVAIAFWPR